jgi:DNA repair protein RadC
VVTDVSAPLTHGWPDVDPDARSCITCARERLGLLWPGGLGDRPQYSRPEELVGLLAPVLEGRDREMAVTVALDVRARVIDLSTTSVGGIDQTSMAPREIFRDALLVGAASIVVAHNHPSGDPTPSAADRAVTRRLAAAGQTLGVPLLDHLVIGGHDAWTSLAREGVL